MPLVWPALQNIMSATNNVSLWSPNKTWSTFIDVGLCGFKLISTAGLKVILSRYCTISLTIYVSSLKNNPLPIPALPSYTNSVLRVGFISETEVDSLRLFESIFRVPPSTPQSCNAMARLNFRHLSVLWSVTTSVSGVEQRALFIF